MWKSMVAKLCHCVSLDHVSSCAMTGRVMGRVKRAPGGGDGDEDAKNREESDTYQIWNHVPESASHHFESNKAY